VSDSRGRCRVSIGVPVYNGERYLSAALDSLLTQTYEDFELIICDNASTDRTGEIARSYAAKDQRVRYARNEKNLGASRNYGRTFALSSGEYFRWAPADDLSGPEFLARCVEVLDREPRAVLAYPKTSFIDEHGRCYAEYDDGLHLQSPRPSERFRLLLQRLGYVNALYGLMRADVVRRTRPLGTYPGWDVVFLADLSLYGTFWEIPEVLFYRRFHPGASSSMDRVQIRAFLDPDRPRRIHLHEWRHLWELSCVVERTPLPVADKMRLCVFLARTAIWGRDKLARELVVASRQLVTSLFREVKG